MSNIRFLFMGGIMLIFMTALLAGSPLAGPGMTLTYTNAIKNRDINIISARLPDGTEFPDPGSLSGGSKPNDNPLIAGATMGGAPDGRDLPLYVDFEWRETPKSPPDPTPMDSLSQAHKDWQKKMMDEFYSYPIKKQRVLIRDRVPTEVVTSVIEANRHTPKDQLNKASIQVYFVWTDYGIKFRWEIWHRQGSQYYSHQGGDEVTPAGTTMIAAYSNAIENNKIVVDPGGPGGPATGGRPRRYPASASGSVFSGSPGFAYTDKPFSGGEKPMVFESEQELPEWVDFKWALLPDAEIPRKRGESESAYHWRCLEISSARPRKSERVLVRSRIPQEVRNEISIATRNAQPYKVASSLIYLYFIWTDSGIKLHWRLRRSRPDGTFVSIREGGDEITKPGKSNHKSEVSTGVGEVSPSPT
ncbi:hypothetical protein [Massilia aerilata]|uniref:Uncharacterized protein n=1 Tax=Massilia aerilata TaxID=453817 RepID=A0ABW0S3H2_9BURK